MSSSSIDLKVYSAEQFKSSVATASQIYLTYGRSFTWANDASPNVSNTSVSTSYEVWRYMIGGKRITGNDVHHVIKRTNWTANTVYTAYDDLSSCLYDYANSKFYILTTDFNVYKCLANNYSSNSTVMPTSVSSNNTTQTADGYTWKYMYTLTSEEQLRFTTSDYMPVKTVIADDGSQQWTVQQSAVSGDIQSILITNAGTNYSNASLITININGDGAGATAIAGINNISNTINSISITNPGSGYTNALVVISSSQGAGATARAIISPIGGHGSDAMYELGGNSLIINTKFDGSEGSILPVTNEFRQISVLKDPLLYSNSNVSMLTVFSELTKVSLTGVATNFQADEFVYQGSSLGSSTFSGRVVEWDSANNLLKLIDTRGTPTTQTILGATSTASGFLTSVTNPDLQADTGKVMYVDNILPISRSEDQADDFKILITF